MFYAEVRYWFRRRLDSFLYPDNLFVINVPRSARRPILVGVGREAQKRAGAVGGVEYKRSFPRMICSAVGVARIFRISVRI
jgi:hypothetical protein